MIGNYLRANNAKIRNLDNVCDIQYEKKIEALIFAILQSYTHTNNIGDRGYII